MTLQFVDANAVAWPFDGSTGITVLQGAEGIFEAPVSLVLDQRIASDGAVLISERRAHRTVVLRLMLADAVAVSPLWGNFLRSLAAGGKLVYDGPNGVRELRDVRLQAPDRAMTGTDLGSRDADAIAVELVALDPWWYGSLVTLSDVFGEPTPWNAELPWNSAIPWNGGSSMSVDVEGDAPAYVRIVVKADSDPVTSASFSCNGVGWTITGVPASDAVTVDSRPGSRGPYLGSSLLGIDERPIDWTLITEVSQIFELPTGESSIVFGAVSDGEPEWTIAWEPRWLTP